MTISKHSELAKRCLLSVRGDPLLLADWERVVFMHFLINPELLRPYVPAPFQLELYEGQACVSLVALTMRRFRPFHRGSLAAWVFRPLARQSFLNVRTYVRCGDEPGALFLWGWLSKPFGVGLPTSKFGLPCGFSSMEYEHVYEAGTVKGSVRENTSERTFRYRAAISPYNHFHVCEPGSLAEFAMERYSGFYCRGTRPYVFRAWHEPWLQTPIEVSIDDKTLLAAKFPLFKDARLAAANFAPGFEGVWLGRPHRIAKAKCLTRTKRSVLSAFYEMP